jgi:hypothetical protein
MTNFGIDNQLVINVSMAGTKESIRQPFYRSCTVDRFFVPQDMSWIGKKDLFRELFYRPHTADRSFVPQDDRKIGYLIGTNHLRIFLSTPDS